MGSCKGRRIENPTRATPGEVSIVDSLAASAWNYHTGAPWAIVEVVKVTFQYPIGKGQSFTKALTLHDGSQNRSAYAGQRYETITLPQIIQLAQKPPSVSKETSLWFIPSEYRDHDARSHSAQRQKGSFRFLTLDVDENNLTLASVDEALDAVIGKAFRIIYSTRSATEEQKKWRALVPLKEAILGKDFAEIQNAFFDLLEGASNGELVPDRALARPAQLIFLPNMGEFYQVRANPSKVLSLKPDHAIIRHRDAKRAAKSQAEAEEMTVRERRMAEREASAQVNDMSPVDHFNTAHSVADLLVRYGYTQAGSSADWKSPFQSSDSYATRDFGEYWVSLSASDAAQEIGAATKDGHRHGDAFDLFCHFEHGGDFNAAVRAYALEAGLDRQSHNTSATEQHSAPQVQDEGQSAKPEQSDAKEPAAPFQFVPVADLKYRAPEYIIGELIETGTLGLMFGDPGCGKSFLAVDLALSVATGAPFHGRDTRQGAVFFIAGEGHSGLARRFEAWSQARGVPLAGVPLFKSERAANFLDGASARAVAFAVARLAEQHGSPALIIIDTLARNFGAGDENNTSDMNEFVAAVDDLKARFPGCSVLIVHHSGHAEKQRARGAIALKGALDCEFRIEKKENAIKLVNTKMKDAEPPPDLHFSFKQVELGGMAKSAVLIAVDAPEEQQKMTSALRLAQETYITATVQNGVWDEGGFRGVHLDDWRAAFYAKHASDNPNTRRQAFIRVRTDLTETGVIAVENDLCLWRDAGVKKSIFMQRDMRDRALQSENVTVQKPGEVA